MKNTTEKIEDLVAFEDWAKIRDEKKRMEKAIVKLAEIIDSKEAQIEELKEQLKQSNI